MARFFPDLTVMATTLLTGQLQIIQAPWPSPKVPRQLCERIAIRCNCANVSFAAVGRWNYFLYKLHG